MEGTDPDNLCEDIVRILRRDNLHEVSANGRELIEEKYSFEAAVDRYRQILSEIDDS
jgi:glycosyltransferase involved in cell wall biosynthesis